MARFPSLVGRTGPRGYAFAAPLLLLVQPLCVMLIYRIAGWTLEADADFWFLPLRRLAVMPMLSATRAATAFAISLASIGALAILSFRRARWLGVGYLIAMLTLVPGAQIAAAAILAVLPLRRHHLRVYRLLAETWRRASMTRISDVRSPRASASAFSFSIVHSFRPQGCSVLLCEAQFGECLVASEGGGVAVLAD